MICELLEAKKNKKYPKETATHPFLDKLIHFFNVFVADVSRTDVLPVAADVRNTSCV